MKKIILLYIIALLSIGRNANAQVSFGGVPYTFRANTSNNLQPNYRSINPTINAYLNSSFSNENLIAEAYSLQSDLGLYGKEISTNIDIISNGTFDQIDSVKVWRYSVESANAEGLQLYFSKFHIPEGGRLYFYDENRKYLLGAYTSWNNPYESNNSTIKFACVPVPVSKLIIEYDQSILIDSVPELELFSIGHVFNLNVLRNPDLNSILTSPCEENINCPAGADWQIDKKSVVLIMQRDAFGDFMGVATGTLINNTLNNGAPYILTAGHNVRMDMAHDFVLDPSANPASLLFLFNYETAFCSTTQGTTQFNYIQSAFGGIHLVSKYDISDFDYALLQLNYTVETISKWDICYAGWDRSQNLSILQKPYTMIHHPNGQEKSISVSEYSDLESVHYTNDAQIDLDAGFYRTRWAIGSMETGSSGSSIFDSYKRIIGILNGGNGCNKFTGVFDPTEYARIAKFSKSWEDGDFGFWLDPIHSNTMTIDRYCPAIPIDNGGETGSGFGGALPPGSTSIGCKTVKFLINDQNPSQKVINVCTSDIWLRPNSASCALESSQWFCKSSTTGCMNCNHVPDKWAAAYVSECNLSSRCAGYYYQLFISVQECDENLNTIGTEYSHWVYIFDNDGQTKNDLDNVKFLNINGYYLPSGFSWQNNKHYRIKVGTNDEAFLNNWAEYSGYIKTYGDNYILNNQNIIRNKLAKNITISNSIIDQHNDLIEIIANESINIKKVTTIKKNTRLYLDDIACNNISTYRNGYSNAKDYVAVNAETNSINAININSNESRTKINKFVINYFPNPASNKINITLGLPEGQMVSSCIYDLNGKKLVTLIDNVPFEGGNHKVFKEIELKSGLYFIVTKINGENIVEKISILNE